MKYNFKGNFYWGSATSGPQTESNKNRSKQVMDHYYDIAQYRFFDEKNVLGALETRYDEYAKIAGNLKFNSLRTSIQWTRLMPDGINVSEDAVKFYRNYFQALKDQGVEVFVNLMHFDMPLWAQKKGGWENKEIIDKFVHYAKVAFDKFSDLVSKWFTFNEPIVPVEAGYLYDFHYPNKVNIKSAMQVQWNSLIAHLKVVDAFKKKKYSQDIGIILNITPAIPRSDHPADLQAARWAELFQAKCYLDPILKNQYPQEIIAEAKDKGFFWEILDSELQLIKNHEKIDILGINFYQPLRVKGLDYIPNWKAGAITFHYYYQDYQMPGRKMNPYRGWEIYPQAVYMALMAIKNEYNNIKTYISENGMGVENEQRFRDKSGQINDTYRIEFLQEHLVWINKAIAQGANCVGYHMWTYIDNWSWMNAYKNRYGFIEFDLATNEFKEKKSAAWMRNVISNNGFD